METTEPTRVPVITTAHHRDLSGAPSDCMTLLTTTLCALLASSPATPSPTTKGPTSSDAAGSEDFLERRDPVHVTDTDDSDDADDADNDNDNDDDSDDSNSGDGISPSTTTINEARNAIVVGAGLGGGARPGRGALAFTTVSVAFRFFDVVEPELIIGMGLHGNGLSPTSPWIDDGEMLQRFGIGTRLVWPSNGVRPFLWLALHHGHATPMADFLKSPVLATLSSTEAGVLHLTGVEGGAGVIVPFVVELQPIFHSPVHLELTARLTGAAIPAFLGSDRDHRFYVLADVGLAVPFRID